MSRVVYFKPGDRVRVITMDNRVGTVNRRSSRTDGLLYDVSGNGWAGTFYSTSLRKVS